MKKLILPSLLFLFNCQINAQITNNEFENWTTVGAYQNPTGWATTNTSLSAPFYPCTKSTDHFPAGAGNYSIRLENNTALTYSTGAGAMAITKSFAFPFKPAFPIVGHPNSLTGYFKFNQQNNDTAFVKIILFNNGVVLNNVQLLADAFVVNTNVSAWTSFSLNLPAYTVADSATIWLSAYYPKTQTSMPKGNSVFYVDNLNFDTFITGVHEEAVSNNVIKLYPNPATEVIALETTNSVSEDMTLSIYTLYGKLIRSEKLSPDRSELNVSELSNGIYLIELQSKAGTQKQKLVIQK